MATIDISVRHGLFPDEAKRRVRAFERDAQQQYGVTAAWSSDGTYAQLGGRVGGGLWVLADRVAIRLELNGLAALVGGAIQEGVERALRQALAG